MPRFAGGGRGEEPVFAPLVVWGCFLPGNGGSAGAASLTKTSQLPAEGGSGLALPASLCYGVGRLGTPAAPERGLPEGMSRESGMGLRAHGWLELGSCRASHGEQARGQASTGTRCNQGSPCWGQKCSPVLLCLRAAWGRYVQHSRPSGHFCSEKGAGVLPIQRGFARDPHALPVGGGGPSAAHPGVSPCWRFPVGQPCAWVKP